MNMKRMIPHGKVDCYRYIAIALLTILPLVSYSEERLMQPVEDVFLEEIAPAWLSQPSPQSAGLQAEESAKSLPEAVMVKPQSFAVRQVAQQPIHEKTKQEKEQVVDSTMNITRDNSVTATRSETQASSFSIETLIESARQGKVEAQYQLGMRYQYGDGVKTDLNKANQWLAKAAESGDARSQHALAMFYQQYATNIEGAKKALLWEKKAADRGSADAQYALGVMFKNGRLVRKNEAEARKWLAMAAQQGHLSAQLVLQE